MLTKSYYTQPTACHDSSSLLPRLLVARPLSRFFRTVCPTLPFALCQRRVCGRRPGAELLCNLDYFIWKAKTMLHNGQLLLQRRRLQYVLHDHNDGVSTVHGCMKEPFRFCGFYLLGH